jgi:hypothetical protein
MSQAAPRLLIALINIENRDFLVSAGHIISFRSMPTPGSPASRGKDAYVVQMSNGSEITCSKKNATVSFTLSFSL